MIYHEAYIACAHGSNCRLLDHKMNPILPIQHFVPDVEARQWNLLFGDVIVITILPFIMFICFQR